MITKKMLRGSASTLALFVALALGGPVLAQDHGLIFLVRHGEKVSEAEDAPLNPAGKKRAQCLAQTLRDANIHAIYVTDVARTQQMAAPLAKALNLKPIIISKKNISGLVQTLKQARRQNILVVNHWDTLPDIFEQLGVEEIKFDYSEFDRLFIVSLAGGGHPSLTALHYCGTP